MRIGVPGQVQLLGDVVDAVRRDPEVTALLLIEQAGEDTGRVEPRRAEPVDRAVSRDQRRGLQVADQAVILDGGIRVH